ncbi:thioredoxin domain-containing protein [Olleya sp. R77988]|uniref:thioredoxin family protein n=1 Tax=Olleya sp. R77988 TaxID=3093875 RepID=UPI0037C639B7
MKTRLTVLLISLFATFAYSQKEITDDNAEPYLLTDDDTLIVLDFYATWCAPCKVMDPILKDLAEKYEGKVNFYKIDIDKNFLDDELNITAVPTYLFIKNSTNLEQIEGSMTKSKMMSLIEMHKDAPLEEVVVEDTADSFDYYNTDEKHGDYDEFSQSVIDSLWDKSSSLNTLAWHAYEEHNDIDVLLKAIKMVERSIELDKNYFNLDTHAALLFKTGNYTKALKKAKSAIEVAKVDNEDYTTTTELIEKIIDKL